MTTEYAPLPPGMGQCSVTGAIVPEDELVTIQGQRVCAEGKAILLDRLRSGEAMPGEVEKPTVLRRFGAIFLDGLIIGVPFALLSGVITSALVSPGASPSQVSMVVGFVTLISTTASLLYFALLHARNGQTVGKMAAKLRVVNNADNSPISTGTAFVRSLLYAGPNYVTAISYIVLGVQATAAVSVLVGVYAIANVLFALLDRDRQRALHDRIAGTRVIEKL